MDKKSIKLNDDQRDPLERPEILPEKQIIEHQPEPEPQTQIIVPNTIADEISKKIGRKIIKPWTNFPNSPIEKILPTDTDVLPN